MITLLGAVIGLFSSAIPDLLGFFKKRQEYKHQLALVELQMTAAAAGHDFRMEQIATEGDIREIEALHKEFAQRRETYRWIEALISSVRPFITYTFFSLYAAVKASQVYLALRATDDVAVALVAAWHEQDQALFATIIAFWFGYRSMKHYRERK